MSHPIRLQAAGPATPKWPSYTGTSTFVGKSSTAVSVWYDASLGAPGLKNATDLLADADRVRAANDAIFGTTGGPVDVIIFALNGQTDGTGGADHLACDYTHGAQIEVCASFGSSMRCSALFEAELSECSMGGNLCGESTGEALSRWCAMVIGNNALADFASVPTWVKDGEANWVDKTRNTDQDYNSIGCGMAFLSWLVHLGHPLTAIAPAMVKLGNRGTLAELYAGLTGDTMSNAWPKFKTALGSANLTTDDPFGGTMPPTPSKDAIVQVKVPLPLPTPGPSGSKTSITLHGEIVWP